MIHPGAISRRDLLRFSGLSLLGLPASGWFEALAAHTADRPAKSCILLFMDGGMSHVDTFDPKPENRTSQFGSIPTALPGVRFAEHLPRLARLAGDLAILRGMSTSEGDHGRGRYFIHTGYRPGVGGIVHPSLGAIVSSQLGQPTDVLPNFVSIDHRNSGRANGAGYAGPMHAPYELLDPSRGIENLQRGGTPTGFARRVGLLEEMEDRFVGRVRTPSAEAHQAMCQRTTALIRSPKIQAFDLSREPHAVRDAYGRNYFGDGCLLARRLVEAGVRFVEVCLQGWDTHQDNLETVRRLSGQLDPAMSALLNDLRVRGLLDSTLVICASEFGRSPRLEGADGRGHYARAWTSVLAGAGLRTGQVIGRTDDQGATVTDHPIGGVDFLATVCRALDIDYTRHFTTRDNRPIRIVDHDEKVVEALFR